MFEEKSVNMLFLCFSSKFRSKIQYVNTLAELHEMIPMEYVHIPDSIVE